MTRKAPLRVVTDAESPAKKKKRAPTVLEAAESGDFLTELVALRRRIATAVSDVNTPARDLAALTRRQLEISKEIQAITAVEERDEVGAAAEVPDEEWAAT